jgi:hypothetical protein
LSAEHARASGRTKQFDEDRDDAAVRASFPLPGIRLCSGKLEAHIRSNIRNSGRENDGFMAGLLSPGPMMVLRQRTPLWANFAGLAEATVAMELDGEFLRQVQLRSPEPDRAMLDVEIADDTTVDYIRLTLVY